MALQLFYNKYSQQTLTLPELRMGLYRIAAEYLSASTLSQWRRDVLHRLRTVADGRDPPSAPLQLDEQTQQKLQETGSKGFQCPITGSVMTDPVIVVDTGHTYERGAIQTWFSKRSTCPVSGVRCPHKRLMPNWALRTAIETAATASCS